MLGSTGGEDVHKLTADESGLPAHTHAVPTGGATASGATAAQKGEEAGWDPFSTANAGGVAAQQAHNNIPPYLAINFIIKYK